MLNTRKAGFAMIAIAVLFPTLITWIYFVALRSTPAMVQQLAYSIGKGIQFSLPVIWLLLVRRQELRWPRPNRNGLWTGIGLGLLIGIAMWSVYAWVLKPIGFFAGPGEQVRAKISGLGLQSPIMYFAVGAFYALFHSLLEEYYWRWFVFRELRLLVPLRWAILVSSLGFMAHHILVLATYFGWSSPATWLFSASVAIGGAIWAWLYDRSQSLTGPWASHCLVDATIFIIGYDLVRDGFGG